MLDFKQNYFELFSIPTRFDVDQSGIEKSYQSFQQELHPDRFANSTDVEKRLSVQATTHVNEAFNTLKHDLRRATYLLSLNGVDLNTETDTRFATDFLMEQMELRESLESIESQADPLAHGDTLNETIDSKISDHKSAFKQAFESDDTETARDVVRRWLFLDKFKRELTEAMYRIEDELAG
ncbi:MAG: Fe-S protein assembly co-chaperone HscB [Pseudomonadota bacterium]